MTRSEDALGGRLALVEEADLTAPQRAVWERLLATQVPEAARSRFTARTGDGRFVGPFNAYVRFPGPGGALLDWAKAQVAAHALAPATREVVTLAVGAVWGAPFEVQAHTAGALSAGVPQEAVDAVLRREGHAELSAEASQAREVADALLVQHRVDETLYRQALPVLGEEGLAAVAHLVGQYVAISALLIVYDVPAVAPSGDAPTC